MTDEDKVEYKVYRKPKTNFEHAAMTNDAITYLIEIQAAAPIAAANLFIQNNAAGEGDIIVVTSDLSDCAWVWVVEEEAQQVIERKKVLKGI